MVHSSSSDMQFIDKLVSNLQKKFLHVHKKSTQSLQQFVRLRFLLEVRSNKLTLLSWNFNVRMQHYRSGFFGRFSKKPICLKCQNPICLKCQNSIWKGKNSYKSQILRQQKSQVFFTKSKQNLRTYRAIMPIYQG